MKVIRSPKSMQRISQLLRAEGEKIGFVPTMGYLHEGHLSLIRLARKKSDVVIVSIFVNPFQFGLREDYQKYPRDLKKDKSLAEDAGCDYLFVPQVEEIYPPDYFTYIDMEKLIQVLEGKSRPGHFRGVTTIVAKLFNIVSPHIALFGQKDFQQAVVVRKMIKDLNFDIKLILAPIKRERDGLALSSRNSYLSFEERKQASVLYESLTLAKKLIINKKERDAQRVVAQMRNLIKRKPLAKIDYIAITDTKNLVPLKRLKGEISVSLAVKFPHARLIDNMKMNIKD